MGFTVNSERHTLQLLIKYNPWSGREHVRCSRHQTVSTVIPIDANHDFTQATVVEYSNIASWSIECQLTL